jgi:archaemetzincin
MKQIRLVGVGNPDVDVLDFLSLTLGESLPPPCLVDSPRFDPGQAFEPNRGQFFSTRLISDMVSYASSFPDAKVLGVTEVDLYIPILTFVFGEAQLGGQVALVSTHRLRQEFYGLPEDRGVFLERVEKEALHELGHTLGLVHCQQPGCVMGFSNSVERVDLKSNAYCADCRVSAGLESVGSRSPEWSA